MLVDLEAYTRAVKSDDLLFVSRGIGLVFFGALTLSFMCQNGFFATKATDEKIEKEAEKV